MRSLYICIFMAFIVKNILYAQTPGTLKWEYQTGDEFVSSPALGLDGTIYVSSGSILTFMAKLNAINPDGTLKWDFTFNHFANRAASPVIANDGTIYLSAASGGHGICKFYAINPDGSLKWNIDLDAIGTTSPTITSDGTLYFGIVMKTLPFGGFYAINPDSTIKWKKNTYFAYVLTSPIIDLKNTIYFISVYAGGLGYGDVNAIDPFGVNQWGFGIAVNYNGETSLAIGSQGEIYVASNKFLAINPDGTFKWQFGSGNTFHTSPSIGTDGTIYIGSYDSTLYAINPNGTEKWSSQIGGNFWSAPAIGDNGNIFIGSSNDEIWSKFYAINKNGTIEWELPTGDRISSSPVIGSDGIIYIGTSEGKLLAIYSGCTGLADSPWPKFGHDNQNTGNANTITSLDINENEWPKSYLLEQNYPNPFNPITNIQFSIPKAEFVTLKIYNLLGQEVTTLVSDKLMPGNYKYSWDASDFASGVYYYKIQTSSFAKTKKLIVLK